MSGSDFIREVDNYEDIESEIYCYLTYPLGRRRRAPLASRTHHRRTRRSPPDATTDCRLSLEWLLSVLCS